MKKTSLVLLSLLVLSLSPPSKATPPSLCYDLDKILNYGNWRPDFRCYDISGTEYSSCMNLKTNDKEPWGMAVSGNPEKRESIQLLGETLGIKAWPWDILKFPKGKFTIEVGRKFDSKGMSSSILKLENGATFQVSCFAQGEK